MSLIVTLIIVGALLLLLETVLPGMIAGIIGVACLICAIILAYARLGGKAGDATLLIVTGILVFGSVLWVRYFPDSALGRVFVSKRSIGDIAVEKPGLVGLTGVAQTTLRPSGMAMINGQKVDVVSEGGYIEKGQPIRVLAVEGMRVIVRAV